MICLHKNIHWSPKINNSQTLLDHCSKEKIEVMQNDDLINKDREQGQQQEKPKIKATDQNTEEN